jgi:hypothetical protein
MIGLLRFVLGILASPFKSKSRLEAENAVLRHQLIVAAQDARSTTADEQRSLVFYSTVSVVSVDPAGSHDHPSRDAGALASRGLSLLLALEVAWRWKSRPLGGRLQIETELRVLIRRMSVENPLWRAPRIHGELLKLGIEVAQSSVAKYMFKRRGPPSQGWRTFLRNHAPDIAAMDLFVVPTIGSTCSMPSSSSGSTAETSSGSTSQQTRQRSGLRVR